MGLRHTGFDTRPPSKNPPAPLSCSLWLSSNLNPVLPLWKKKKTLIQMWTGFSFMCSWEESADAASLVRFHSSFVLFSSILCDRTRFAKKTGCLFFFSSPSCHWQPLCTSLLIPLFTFSPDPVPAVTRSASVFVSRVTALIVDAVWLRLCLLAVWIYFKREKEKGKRKVNLGFWSFYDFPVAPVSSSFMDLMHRIYGGPWRLSTVARSQLCIIFFSSINNFLLKFLLAAETLFA